MVMKCMFCGYDDDGLNPFSKCLQCGQPFFGQSESKQDGPKMEIGIRSNLS